MNEKEVSLNLDETITTLIASNAKLKAEVEFLKAVVSFLVELQRPGSSKELRKLEAEILPQSGLANLYDDYPGLRESLMDLIQEKQNNQH